MSAFSFVALNLTNNILMVLSSPDTGSLLPLQETLEGLATMADFVKRYWYSEVGHPWREISREFFLEVARHFHPKIEVGAETLIGFGNKTFNARMTQDDAFDKKFWGYDPEFLKFIEEKQNDELELASTS